MASITGPKAMQMGDMLAQGRDLRQQTREPTISQPGLAVTPMTSPKSTQPTASHLISTSPRIRPQPTQLGSVAPPPTSASPQQRPVPAYRPKNGNQGGRESVLAKYKRANYS